MRIFLILLVGIALLNILPVGLAAEGKIFPFDYQLVRLENGFKAYLIRTPAPGQIPI